MSVFPATCGMDGATFRASPRSRPRLGVVLREADGETPPHANRISRRTSLDTQAMTALEIEPAARSLALAAPDANDRSERSPTREPAWRAITRWLVGALLYGGVDGPALYGEIGGTRLRFFHDRCSALATGIIGQRVERREGHGMELRARLSMGANRLAPNRASKNSVS